MKLFQSLQNTITKHYNSNAFLINSIYYKYSDFALSISKIRKSIEVNCNINEKNIGLVVNDDLETYAAIIALWFEGKAYVPLNPTMPRDRNVNVLQQASITTIIDSSAIPLFSNYNLIRSSELEEATINLEPKLTSDEELAYILFTSGTTGKPKGVPISRANLTGFIDALWDIGFDINENDKCLQMADLTFDFSVMPYVAPLVKGACVCTIPKNKIKYNYIYKLMNDDGLTVVFMVPSILLYLRPHFTEMQFPKIRFSLFCGEALHAEITEEWKTCIPNAIVFNVYGPTEATVFCTYYEVKSSSNKAYNDILSIGKPMKGTYTVIVDPSNKILQDGEAGELCLASVQLTPGYWNDESKNKESFFTLKNNGKEQRFYKTGDLCKRDEDGDIFYLDRMDFQTQIQGFRVELSEIEYYAKEFLEKINIIAIPFENTIGNTEIGLVIESNELDYKSLVDYLKTKLPVYMVPKKVKFVDRIELNVNGKIDRKKMKLLFTISENE